jgi:hypothetical protein
MATIDKSNNAIIEPLAAIPTMMGSGDLKLVRQVASQLPKGGRILEFGPWLGGVTLELSQFGNCHVVDRFEWTSFNSELLPGLFEPGQSFRPEFDRLMELNNVDVTVHECAFSDFEWSSDPINMCLIDAPYSGKGLMDCIRPIASSFTKDCRVLIKHGANAERISFIAAIHRLLSEGYFEVEDVGQPAWCNIAVLKTTPKTADLQDLDWNQDALLSPPSEIDTPDPWGGELYLSAMYANAIEQGNWLRVYEMLDQQIPKRAILKEWDEMERRLNTSGVTETILCNFATVLDVHNDVPRMRLGNLDPTHSFHAALRYSWIALEGNESRPQIFDIDALAAAFVANAFSVVNQLGGPVSDKDISLIGTRLDLFGTAIMAAGARSFLGIEVTDSNNDSTIPRMPIAGAAIIVPLTNSDVYLREHFDVIGVLDNFTLNTQLEQRLGDLTQMKAAKSAIFYPNVGH